MFDTALQYGALGLLALVLVAIGAWVKKYTEQQLQVSAAQQKFIQDIATKAMATQDAHTAAWKMMTTQTLEAQTQFTALIRNEFKASQAEHEVITKALATLTPRGA